MPDILDSKDRKKTTCLFFVGFIVMHEHHVEGQLFTLYSSFEWIDVKDICTTSLNNQDPNNKSTIIYESIKGTFHIFIFQQ